MLLSRLISMFVYTYSLFCRDEFNLLRCFLPESAVKSGVWRLKMMRVLTPLASQRARSFKFSSNQVFCRYTDCHAPQNLSLLIHFPSNPTRQLMHEHHTPS